MNKKQKIIIIIGILLILGGIESIINNDGQTNDSKPAVESKFSKKEKENAYDFWCECIETKYPDAKIITKYKDVDFIETEDPNYINGVIEMKGKNKLDEIKNFKVECRAYINSQGTVATKLSGMLGEPIESSQFDEMYNNQYSY